MSEHTQGTTKGIGRASRSPLVPFLKMERLKMLSPRESPVPRCPVFRSYYQCNREKGKCVSLRRFLGRSGLYLFFRGRAGDKFPMSYQAHQLSDIALGVSFRNALQKNFFGNEDLLVDQNLFRLRFGGFLYRLLFFFLAHGWKLTNPPLGRQEL